MTRYIRYEVIVGSSIEDLKIKVDDLLKGGYVPIGGMVIMITHYNQAQVENHNLPYNSFEEYCQTMVLPL